tara:strand:+ start:189397 stop:189924 length:528 start_codon:yes stop_codon:yes gene_type:complete
MIDKYFNHALFYDIIAAALITLACFGLNWYDVLPIPNIDFLLSTTSDIANIAFTSAGFVLTFLTLFVSFKISATPFRKKKKQTLEESYKKHSLFNLFLNSSLYVETIRHLKNAVKELIIIAIVGYFLKLSIGSTYSKYLFYYDIFGLVIISMTLWRSMLVLTGVLNVDNVKKSNM